jgi:proteasome lid subunit RPN8/RPN11
MSVTTFNLADLFEKTFGYKTLAFKPEFKKVQSSRTEQGAQGSPYYAQDALGQEYFMPVTLMYADSASHTPGVSGADNQGAQRKWDLPYPVISVTSKKTIIETPLTERRGTVKELINIQDYEIIIKGFMIGKNGEFPENDVTTLRTIYEQNAALSIQSPVTDIFLLRPDRSGSDQVVIKELKFPAVKGNKNVRPYELHMVSDEPFNLISIS